MALLAGMGFAQDSASLKRAPLNPDFIQYVKEREEGKLITRTRDGYPLTDIPPTLDMNRGVGQWVFPGKSEADLPASYDLRTLNRLTSVKDQKACGSCWTFATLGNIESRLMPGENRDFSENHIKNTHGLDFKCCEGGNAFLSTAYLSRWSGPVNEADDPYSDDENNCVSPPSVTVRKHIQQILWIPKRAGDLDNANLKQAVVDYGAVHVSMCWDDNSYNAANAAYYYTGTAEVGGHAVCVVGWDDNFDKNKFLPAAPANGAFIVRNSWSAGWGDSGYFYCSYYDSKFGKRAVHAVYPGVEATDNYDRIYYYDPLGYCSDVGFGDAPTAWFANVFTAAASEQLKAVSWMVGAPNANYEIFIHTSPTNGPVNPAGAAHTQTGTIASMGYHTVALTTPVNLTAGQKFSIIIKQTLTGLQPVPIEDVVTDYSSGATSAAGQSWVSSDGAAFTDITTVSGFEKANVCVKGFTKTGSSPAICGDADGSGVINMTDAVQTLECYLTRKTTGCNPAVMDVNNSGAITPLDSQNIYQHYTTGGVLTCPGRSEGDDISGISPVLEVCDLTIIPIPHLYSSAGIIIGDTFPLGFSGIWHLSDSSLNRKVLFNDEDDGIAMKSDTNDETWAIQGPFDLRGAVNGRLWVEYFIPQLAPGERFIFGCYDPETKTIRGREINASSTEMELTLITLEELSRLGGFSSIDNVYVGLWASGGAEVFVGSVSFSVDWQEPNAHDETVKEGASLQNVTPDGLRGFLLGKAIMTAQDKTDSDVNKDSKVNAADLVHMIKFPSLAKTLNIGSAGGAPGETVIISITESNSESSSAFGFDLKFDTTRLQYVAREKGTATSNWSSVEVQPIAGGVRIGAFAGPGTPLSGANREICRIHLSVLAAACPGQALTLTAENIVDHLAGSSVNTGSVTPVCGGFKVVIGNVSGAPQQTVEVPVTVDGMTVAGKAFGLILKYDTAKLTFVDVLKGTDTNGWLAVSGSSVTGGARIGGYAGAGAGVSGSGKQLFKVRLTINAAACPGSAISITADTMKDMIKTAGVTPGTVTPNCN